MTVGATDTLFADRYRLRDRLANGGQGEVWRALDEVLDRPVAVKLVRADLEHDETALRRFEREARAAAGLVHPNVAQVLDYTHDQGLAGIVMELLEGQTLAERIREHGPLPIDDVVAVGTGVLAALAAAHDAGLVHRDVKPSNVIITTDGFVKLTDFGVASASGDGDTTLTQPGTVIGSAPYLAPEQLRGEPSAPPTDLYSAGLILYEALTGTLPFEADTPPAVALARLHHEPVPLRSRRADVPEPVAAVVMRALQPDPEARFSTADAMRGALEAAGAALEDHGGSTTETVPVAVPGDDTVEMTSTRVLPVAPPEHIARRRSRMWLVALLALGLFLAGMILGRIAFGGSGVGDVETPGVVGMNEAEAVAQLENVGLRPEVERVDATEPEGTVVGQDVDAGEFVAPGTSVRLAVSSGPPCCQVPQVTAMPLGEATQLIEAEQLVVGDVGRQASPQPEDTVLVQDPPPGEQLDEGGAVHLVVSSGEPEDDDGDAPPGRGRGRGNDNGNGNDDD